MGGVKVGKERLPLPEVIVILQNSVRPRTELLIGAASAVIWASFWYFALAGEKGKTANSDFEVISFDPALEEVQNSMRFVH